MCSSASWDLRSISQFYSNPYLAFAEIAILTTVAPSAPKKKPLGRRASVLRESGVIISDSGLQFSGKTKKGFEKIGHSFKGAFSFVGNTVKKGGKGVANLFKGNPLMP